MENMRKQVAIYSCGGCGINIVGSLPAYKSKGQADAQAYAIDTSRSNLHNSAFSADNVYLFEGVDGSGQERAENHALIERTTLQILQKFPPGDFNIVVHSGGGGSGSVIAYNVVKALIEQDRPVVIICVGSTNSQKEVSNTQNTLASYDRLAVRLDKPIVVHYLENSASASRKAIDGGAQSAIQALLMLFSGLNAELDSADIRSWIRNAGAPEVFSLQFCPTTESYARAGTVISVATLARMDQNVGLSPAPAYQAVGYATAEDVIESLTEPLHFVLSGNLIDSSAKALATARQENEKRLKSAVKRDRLPPAGGDQTESGLIL